MSARHMLRIEIPAADRADAELMKRRISDGLLNWDSPGVHTAVLTLPPAEVDGERIAISLKVAQHVLYMQGDTNYGLDGGGRITRLLQYIAICDENHRAAIRLIEPEYTFAFLAVTQKSWGLEWLRGIVKAELDHVEQGLDMSVLS